MSDAKISGDIDPKHVEDEYFGPAHAKPNGYDPDRVERGDDDPQIELPHSVEAEQSVLGGLLIDGTGWDRVAGVVKAGDFYRNDHRVIFDTMGTLAGAGTSIDLLTVMDALERAGRLDDAGGLAYLGTLAKLTPTASNVHDYARIVRERAQLRRLLALHAEVARAVVGGASSQQITEALASVIDTLRDRRTRPKPIDWAAWKGRTPPPREWWQQDWVSPEPLLMAGAGGIGKSLLLQTAGTAMALGRELLGAPARPLRILLWLCEDQESEIVRRQDAICAHFGIEREELDDMLYIEPRVGFDNSLFELLSHGKPTFTPEFRLLHQQINDLKIDFLGLDNIGQVYGANENDRHHVTVFVNGIRGLVQGRPFCPTFVGHISRAQGSEFSGSAAWENACRMRWYMGTRLPDQKPLEEEEGAQSDIVYLAKRKANYSEKDYRRLRYQNGLLLPEGVGEGRRFDQTQHNELADDIVLGAIPKLLAVGIQPTDGKTAGDYLPTQIISKGYAQGHTKQDLAGAMNRLMGAGRLKRAQVGMYSNRTPKYGLVIAS